MSIAELHSYFDLLLDKMGDPYFTDEEKDNFISQAAIEYVKQHLPSAEGGIVNLELDQLVYNNLSTLVFVTGTTTMGATGNISVSSIQSLLNTVSSSTEPMMGVLAVSWTSGGEVYPVKFTRHNDWFSFGRNIFKKGTSTAPRYKFDAVNFTFSPISQTPTISFTILKQPKAVSLSGGVTLDLPSHTHKAVVEIAADLASTSIRDQVLQQMNKQ